MCVKKEIHYPEYMYRLIILIAVKPDNERRGVEMVSVILRIHSSPKETLCGAKAKKSHSGDVS